MIQNVWFGLLIFKPLKMWDIVLHLLQEKNHDPQHIKSYTIIKMDRKGMLLKL
jgi:hypothetical protein